jgi:hypothetical protein
MATNKYRAWTAAEDKLLKELTIAGESTKNIAAVLGRTYAAVNARRRYLIKKGYENEINNNCRGDFGGAEHAVSLGGGED